MNVTPENVSLPEEIVTEHVKKINEGLVIGTVGFKIPINFRLLERLKKEFPDWQISHKEYMSSIKIMFSAREKEVVIEIKKHE